MSSFTAEIGDVLLYLIYLFLATAYLWRWLNKDKALENKEKTALQYAWAVKLGVQFVSYSLYKFYYGGGDTINYMSDARFMAMSLFYNPEETFRLIGHALLGGSVVEYLNKNPAFYAYWVRMRLGFTYATDPASATVSMLYVPFMLLSFGAEKASLVLFALFSMLIQVRFYKLVKVLYPVSYQSTLPVQFFLPSILAWTTTPYKEAFALHFLLLAMYLMFYRGMNVFRYGVAAAFLYLVYQVKPYILLSFLPAFGAIQLYRYSRDAKYRLFFYLSIALSIPLLLYVFSRLLQSPGKYSAENILSQAHIVSLDLRYNETYYQTTGGSVYDIGDFEPTLPGILQKFPIAFVTGLLRPFVWESRKPIILLPALENFILLLLLTRLTFLYGFGRIGAKMTGNIANLALVLTSVIFLFMMGLTSGNFGNLVRYRVPGLFFFYLVLFAAYGELKKEAAHRRSRQQRAWRGLGGSATGLGSPAHRSP